ncbi:MAG TPA: HAD family phosphatase [Chryseolinea sp.]|nr:HAD family phosphatase [Chryseolinea sp.]
MAIKNIIFDLGGVLLNLDFNRTYDALRKLGIDKPEEIIRLGHGSVILRAHESGKITDEEFVQSLKKFSPVPVNDSDIINAWNMLLLDFPKDRIEWLRGLKKKYRLFLFSNTNGIHVAHFRKMYSDAYDNAVFDDHFEKAYYSHIAGLIKPDLEAFHLVVRENNLAPEETLFIDDTLANVEAARQAGLKALQVVAGATVLDLELEHS